jgi:hypothetical protein
MFPGANEKLNRAKPLQNCRSCQCANILFPVPLTGLGHSYECIHVIGTHDTNVLTDISSSQECAATLVNGDCLEMTERIRYNRAGETAPPGSGPECQLPTIKSTQSSHLHCYAWRFSFLIVCFSLPAPSQRVQQRPCSAKVVYRN